MEQNYQALIANAITRYPFLKVNLWLWKRLNFSMAMYGRDTLMVPQNVNTAPISYDRETLRYGELETKFDEYKILKMKSGWFVSDEAAENYEAANRFGMGISPFWTGLNNMAMTLTSDLERATYVGMTGYTGPQMPTVDQLQAKGFLNNPNTIRVRAPKAVSDMTAMEIYDLIKGLHSQLVQTVGTIKPYAQEPLGINIVLPTFMNDKLQDLITIPVGGVTLPTKLIDLLRSLPMVENVEIVQNWHVAAPSGTTTSGSTQTDFTVNGSCIFVGFNNSGICGIGVDYDTFKSTPGAIARLLDENNGILGNDGSYADLIAGEVKSRVLPSLYTGDRTSMEERIDLEIIGNLRALARDYAGFAPENIIGTRFSGWDRVSGLGQVGWAGYSSLYTAAGIVTMRGAMIACDTQVAAV